MGLKGLLVTEKLGLHANPHVERGHTVGIGNGNLNFKGGGLLAAIHGAHNSVSGPVRAKLDHNCIIDLCIFIIIVLHAENSGLLKRGGAEVELASHSWQGAFGGQGVLVSKPQLAVADESITTRGTKPAVVSLHPRVGPWHVAVAAVAAVVLCIKGIVHPKLTVAIGTSCQHQHVFLGARHDNAQQRHCGCHKRAAPHHGLCVSLRTCVARARVVCVCVCVCVLWGIWKGEEVRR